MCQGIYQIHVKVREMSGNFIYVTASPESLSPKTGKKLSLVDDYKLKISIYLVISVISRLGRNLLLWEQLSFFFLFVMYFICRIHKCRMDSCKCWWEAARLKKQVLFGVRHPEFHIVVREKSGNFICPRVWTPCYSTQVRVDHNLRTYERVLLSWLLLYLQLPCWVHFRHNGS